MISLLLLAMCGRESPGAAPPAATAQAAAAEPTVETRATPFPAPPTTAAAAAIDIPPLPTATEEAAPMQSATAESSAGAAPSAPEQAKQAGRRVEELLATLSLEEKVGQLFLVFFRGPTLSPALREMIVDYHVGGIVLFAIADNIQNLAQVADLIEGAQREAVGAGAGVPLLVAVDQEGGPVGRLTDGATVFPSQMALGATGAPELARTMARVTATELRALGINMNLAPVLDVNSNPANPIIGLRSLGSDPALVARLGQAMVAEYALQGVIATAKHFPGHGDTAVDSHVGLPLVGRSWPSLQAVELLPFQAAVAAGVAAVMTAHILFPAIEPDPGLPATLSTRVLQELLRGQMGFDGLIVTDSLTMGALVQTVGSTEAARMAFEAGADILAFGADRGHQPAEQQAAYRRVLERLRSGAVPLSRLDDAVRRILLAKARHGILDWQPGVGAVDLAQVGTTDHLAAAQAIAQESITLVRDEAALLPIDPAETVLVIWPQGRGDLGRALAACHPGVQSLAVGLDPTAAEIRAAVQQAAAASLVVVATADAYRRPAQVQLVRALRERRLVVAALGVPYDLANFPEVTTYVAAYGHVAVSLEALARSLCGLEAPRGRLPVEIPGLYPQGHGLTVSR